MTLTEAERQDGVRAALALTHNLAEGRRGVVGRGARVAASLLPINSFCRPQERRIDDRVAHGVYDSLPRRHLIVFTKP